jgi:uncharacterized protein (TIGR02145 family)
MPDTGSITVWVKVINDNGCINSVSTTIEVARCINQLQGSCTFTQPANVGTFANFPSNYSASTFVSLTDERDSKVYTVVKIAGRWVMAQNLNYQKDLTFNANSNQANGVSFISVGSGVPAIGSFWCPGGDNSVTSTWASCDVWGALYSWETAMMVDGRWTSSAQNSSAWSEPTDNYGASTSTGNTQNHARSNAGDVVDGRGICPPNWHVPTDEEWGVLLNAMETGTQNHNSNYNTWLGYDAGKCAKAKCTADNSTSYVNDTQANWYYHADNVGTDDYGFRVLPAGIRLYDGSYFNYRGINANFWSSSAYSTTTAWIRYFTHSRTTVYRNNYNRSNGFSVRCIRDE